MARSSSRNEVGDLSAVRGQAEGVVAVYCALGRAAELQDAGDTVSAEAWVALGKAILAALWSRSAAAREALRFAARPPDAAEAPSGRSPAEACRRMSLSAFAADMRRRSERIREELGVLAEAGQRGGTISAETVSWLSESLDHDVLALQRAIDRLSLFAGIPCPAAAGPAPAPSSE